MKNLMLMIANGFRKINSGLLPGLCVLCGTNTEETALCEPCRRELPWLQNPCPHCGLTGGGSVSATPLICGQCLQNPPPYQSTLALFDYLSPIDHCILSLKFHQKLEFAKILGELLAERVARHYLGKALPQLLIPVPLHKRRLRERGFNQALEIARPMAKQLRIPLEEYHCTRVVPTPPQSHESAEQRRKNLHQAFRVRQKLSVDHVAIIDDVVTTGSTVSELAVELQKNGVKRVDVCCIVRTSLKNRSANFPAGISSVPLAGKFG